MKKLPDPNVFDFSLKQVLRYPIQPMQSCSSVSVCFALNVCSGFRMLPILTPQLIRRYHGHAKAYLDVKELIVVLAPMLVRLLYEPTHAFCHLTPHHDSGGDGYTTDDTRPFVATQEGSEQLWRLDKCVGLDTAFFHKVAKVALAVFKISRPAEPVQAGPINHAGFGMRAQNRQLLFQRVSEPDIISIQKADVPAFSIPDTQVTRGTHASILVARVLQVAHLLRVSFGIAQGNL